MTIDQTAQDFILQQVIPAVGVTTGTFMTFAPYRAVLKASRDGNLGDLNPTPWVLLLGNCAGNPVIMPFDVSKYGCFLTSLPFSTVVSVNHRLVGVFVSSSEYVCFLAECRWLHFGNLAEYPSH